MALGLALGNAELAGKARIEQDMHNPHKANSGQGGKRSDVNVLVGGALSFTPFDGSRPQVVRVRTAFDPDTVDDNATIFVNAVGLTTIPIAVSVLDLAGPQAVFANGFE